jgi:hypothetical protein
MTIHRQNIYMLYIFELNGANYDVLGNCRHGDQKGDSD